LFKSKNWSESIVKYQEALTLKPNETYPKTQIELCNEQLRLEKEKFEAEQALNARYQSALTQADNTFKASKWEESITLYREALTIKPDEKYPQQQIALAIKEIENLDAVKASENTRLYREKITEANSFINEKNYQAAINSLKSALNYRPNDDFATKKIAEVQKIIDDATFAKSEYNRLIAEGDAAFANEKYRDAITSYRAAMRHQPDEMYPRKQISNAERNMEFTPEKRSQLAQESLQRAEEAVKTNTFEAAMRAYGNAYYWYPEDGETTRNKIKSIVSTLEAGTEKNLLEQPMILTSNRRGTIELDIKPTEIKGTAYLLFKISGNYENNVNVFVRWGRFGNEAGSTVVTLVYGLDDIYYCAEIKGAANGLTWISFIPENTDVTIDEAKLMSR